MRAKKYEKGEEITKALRKIICDEIAKQNVTEGPIVELYSYFTDQCEEAQIDEEYMMSRSD